MTATCNNYNIVTWLQGISLVQAFGWEAIMTFLLVVTIYSVAVGQPDFGVMGPLAIGLVRLAH
jgi:glycerol uptake facilitator-like aquaporin